MVLKVWNVVCICSGMIRYSCRVFLSVGCFNVVVCVVTLADFRKVVPVDKKKRTAYDRAVAEELHREKRAHLGTGEGLPHWPQTCISHEHFMHEPMPR